MDLIHHNLCTVEIILGFVLCYLHLVIQHGNIHEHPYEDQSHSHCHQHHYHGIAAVLIFEKSFFFLPAHIRSSVLISKRACKNSKTGSCICFQIIR